MHFKTDVFELEKSFNSVMLISHKLANINGVKMETSEQCRFSFALLFNRDVCVGFFSVNELSLSEFSRNQPFYPL